MPPLQKRARPDVQHDAPSLHRRKAHPLPRHAVACSLPFLRQGGVRLSRYALGWLGPAERRCVMACQIIPIVRVGDFRFLGTIINELPARDTQGRATASGGTAPVSAPSHCIECNEWVDSACAYTGCPLRSPKACAGGVSESFGRNATGGFFNLFQEAKQ